MKNSYNKITLDFFFHIFTPRYPSFDFPCVVSVVELTSNLNQNGSCSHSIWLRFLSISSAKSCGRPNDIPNGKIIGYVYSFKEKIRYECNEGYNLKGPSYRTCQANEKWGDKDPICEGKIFDLVNIRIITYVTVISCVSITVLWGKYIIFFKFTIVFPLIKHEWKRCM